MEFNRTFLSGIVFPGKKVMFRCFLLQLFFNHRFFPQILFPGTLLFNFINFLLDRTAFLRRNPRDGFFRAPGKLSRQIFKAAHFVEVLAPFVPADDHGPGWPVVQPHGAFGFVLVLPPPAAGGKSVDVATGKEIRVGIGHCKAARRFISPRLFLHARPSGRAAADVFYKTDPGGRPHFPRPCGRAGARRPCSRKTAPVLFVNRQLLF